MFRFVGPVLFILVGIYAWNYNTSHNGSSYLLFPLLDLIPSAKGNVQQQAILTYQLLLFIGGGWLALEVLIGIRRQRQQIQEEE